MRLQQIAHIDSIFNYNCNLDYLIIGKDSMEHRAFLRIVSEPRSVRWVWFVYLVLYAIAIPWYWPDDYIGPIVLGFPLWVATTLLSIFALALWTAYVIHRFWRADGEDS